MVTTVSQHQPSSESGHSLESGLVEGLGGLEIIISQDRIGYFRYLQLVSQVYGVLKIASDADDKVSIERLIVQERRLTHETTGPQSHTSLC